MEGVMKLVKDIIQISNQIHSLYQKLASIEKYNIKKNIEEYKKILEYIDLCTELEDKYYLELNNYNYNEIIEYFNKILKYSAIEHQIKNCINDRFKRKLTSENIHGNNNQDEIYDFFYKC